MILAAGDFPSRGSEPERLLKSADAVIACDSAAVGYRKRFHKFPDVVIGDLDSCDGFGGKSTPCRVIRIDDQDTNDLEKAIAYARVFAADAEIIVVGAAGRREDHAIGNVFRALEAGVPIVSEYGDFLPVRGTLRFRTVRNAGVSVFVADPSARMTSVGLKWKLKGVRFASPYTATLNRATGESVTVASDRPAFVYRERPHNAVRAVVSLGSNQGDRAAHLRRALSALAKLPQTRLLDASTVIETDPVGVPSEFADLRFLNQAAAFETTLGPLEFSRAMHAVEDRLGRVRTVRNGPRTIDLDLILFGDLRMNGRELVLPHPRAAERDFVTTPLKELGIEL